MKQKRLNIVYEEERNLLFDNKKKNYRIKESDEKSEDYDYKNIEIKDIYNKDNKNEEVVGVFDSWWKYFIAYFLASVGDKSQIATILITSKYNFIFWNFSISYYRTIPIISSIYFCCNCSIFIKRIIYSNFKFKFIII